MFGIDSPYGWRFRVETDDAALLDDDELVEKTERHRVVTWRSALKQLDAYPWTQLFQLDVHPEFFERVHKALQAREKKGIEIPWFQWA